MMNVAVVSRAAALYQAVLNQCSGVQGVKVQYAAPEDPAGVMLNSMPVCIHLKVFSTALRSHVQEAEVLIADPADIGRLLSQHALPSAKWVHCCYAGTLSI